METPTNSEFIHRKGYLKGYFVRCCPGDSVGWWDLEMGLVKPDPSDSVHIDLNPGQASTLAGILERFSETGSLVDALGHVGLKYETADWYTKRLKTSYCCSELIFWVHYGRLYLSAADFRYENHIIFTKSSARFISGILYGTPLHIVREFNLRMQKSLDG